MHPIPRPPRFATSMPAAGRIATAFAIAAFARTLFAATIAVGPPPASIQAAIDSANGGDTVQLSAGTYVQEFQVVSKSLSIVGAGRDVTIVQAPSAATRLTQSFASGGITWWAIVLVDNQATPTAQSVTIRDLTVDGSDQQDTVVPPIYGNSNRFAGIAFHEAGGTVQNVHVTNMRQTANFNELAGTGIVNASAGATPVTFGVADSVIDFYQRGGLDFRGASLTANVTNTTVDRGYTLTPNTATATPNGIQYSVASAGSVTGSRIDRNISTVNGPNGTGILLFMAGSVSVSDNTFDSNDAGLYALNAPDLFAASGNTVAFTGTPGVNDAIGIVVDSPLGSATLSANRIDGMAGFAMVLASGDRNFILSGNHFVGSGRGLLVAGNGVAGPIVSMNGDVFSGIAGNYIELETSPHDIWPTTASVRFDGRISGHMTLAQFDQIQAKIVDRHDDPALGLVLDFIEPLPPQQVPVDDGFALLVLGVALAVAAKASGRTTRNGR